MGIFKKFFSGMFGGSAMMGDVVFEAEVRNGQNNHSVFQWRVKRSPEGGKVFVGLQMKPDYYAGAQGSPTNYINFDLAQARQVRYDLDLCIGECERLTRASR